MTIPCHLSRFYLFSMLEDDTDFGQVQVMAISMAFPKKMMGFPSDLVSFSNQTAVNIKRHEKLPVIFFIGLF